MRELFAYTLAVTLAATATSAEDEMPLWSYFDKYWTALDTVCGFAVSDPADVVEGLSSGTFGEGIVAGVGGMPLGLVTTGTEIAGAFLSDGDFSFFVTVATLPTLTEVTCESGEADLTTMQTLGNLSPEEVSRQLNAWLENQENFEYAGGQLMIKMSADSEPFADNEFDYVISSPIGGQNTVYTVGIYGAGLDLMLVHQLRQ